MAKDANVYFKQLNLQETKSKLALLALNKKNLFTVWLKGDSKKYILCIDEYFRSKNEFQVSGDLPSEFLKQELLFTFELSGLHFFGKCKPVSISKDRSFIDMDFDVFKSERRANFRLLAYPHHEITLNIFIGKNEIEKSNVVEMQTKMSQTKLFNNFLEILDNDSSDADFDMEDYLEFRVIDISVTGLAFQFGEIENNFFPKMNIELGKMYLNFNGDLIELAGGEILYKLDYLSNNKKNRMYKAGVRFTNVDTNQDNLLGKLINKSMRGVESEFEDFIK